MHYIIQINPLFKVIQWLTLTLLMLINITISAKPLDMTDVLTASLSNTQSNMSGQEQLGMINYQSSSWLMAFPTIGFNYLDRNSVV